MEMRDRLIELLEDTAHEKGGMPSFSDIADHLLANGVIALDTGVISHKNRPLITHFAGVPMDDVLDLVRAKQEGRIIVPPCKVGDKVYLPCLNDWGDIENYTITEFVLDNDGLCFVVDDEDRECHSIDEIGKTVFLTKEEAEKALKERDGNG